MRSPVIAMWSGHSAKASETSLSATGAIAAWCWWFWALSILQATAGILVVHARLDARIALRGAKAGSGQFRQAAFVTQGAIACAAVSAVATGRGCIAAALAVIACGYGYDLFRQRDAAALQLPLKTVGQRALALSSIFSALLIAGLWSMK